MFSHWGSVSSPHEEQAITGPMSSTPRARVTTEMSGHRPKSDRRRSDARSGMNEAWEDAAEDDEDRPGRLLHQAVIYKNVELLQVENGTLYVSDLQFWLACQPSVNLPTFLVGLLPKKKK